MHTAFTRTDHRPWPLPATRWTWRQTWCDLCFAHWPIPASALRPLVPDELEIQSHGGTSWIGIVPFRMEGVTRRPLPDVPGLSAFPELNVRLYVEREGRPGVWFLSLDATNRLAVWAARRFFHLPYHRAAIAIRRAGNAFTYAARRLSDGRRLVARYEPVSEPYEAEPGTLEHWLTERYCLYARDSAGRILRTEVHHVPWSLQRAALEIEVNQMCEGLVELPSGPPPLLHFATRLDVAIWSPQGA